MSESRRIRRHVLQDGDVSVAILNLGCITQQWLVPHDGALVPVVLGYDNPLHYGDNRNYFGVIAGRVAGRISGSGFSIGGVRYDLPANEVLNHLHGGARGLHWKIWDMQPDGARTVRLCLESKHGDQGYPGNVTFEVTITLSGHELSYDMRAHTDRPTPINLAQHSYYNLAGRGGISDHHLQINAGRFTPTDAAMIPTGQIDPVDGHAFDFRQGQAIRDADPERSGFDMNFVLDSDGAQPAAILRAPNGLRLSLITDQPCLQLFTAAKLRPTTRPLRGQTHPLFSGLCLEPQQFPNAVNTPGFPSVLIGPDQPYHQNLRVTISGGDCP